MLRRWGPGQYEAFCVLLDLLFQQLCGTESQRQSPKDQLLERVHDIYEGVNSLAHVRHEPIHKATRPSIRPSTKGEKMKQKAVHPTVRSQLHLPLQIAQGLWRTKFQFNVAGRPQRPYRVLGTGSGAQDGHLDFHYAQELCSSMLFTSTETTRTIKDGEPRTATSTFTMLKSSVLQCCLRPQKPQGLLRTGSPGRPPRLSHSSRTLVLHSSMLLYVHRDRTDYWGVQDVHLDFHIAPELWTEKHSQPFCITMVRRVCVGKGGRGGDGGGAGIRLWKHLLKKASSSKQAWTREHRQPLCTVHGAYAVNEEPNRTRIVGPTNRITTQNKIKYTHSSFLWIYGPVC